MRFSTKQQIWGLIGWLGITFIAAAVGAAATVDAPSFYQALNLPSWAPASSVFAPVWTLLYLMMGIAAWLVWRQAGFNNARTALTLYIMQLIFNALWSWTFFAWHQGSFSFMVIVFLWLLVAATLYQFWKINRSAGVLLMPYLLWLTYAGALNLVVWQMNPSLLGN